MTVFQRHVDVCWAALRDRWCQHEFSTSITALSFRAGDRCTSASNEQVGGSGTVPLWWRVCGWAAAGRRHLSSDTAPPDSRRRSCASCKHTQEQLYSACASTHTGTALQRMRINTYAVQTGLCHSVQYTTQVIDDRRQTSWVLTSVAAVPLDRHRRDVAATAFRNRLAWNTLVSCRFHLFIQTKSMLKLHRKVFRWLNYIEKGKIIYI